MRRFGILGAVAVIVAIAASSVCARAATAEVGKPLALLAGLSPPHEAKHKHFRHVAHATSHHVSHAKAAHEKTVGRTRHARMAAAHARHASARKLARREYEHHEKAVTASAFAEEPPVQAAASPTPPSLTPAAVQPKRNEASVGGAGALPPNRPLRPSRRTHRQTPMPTLGWPRQRFRPSRSYHRTRTPRPIPRQRMSCLRPRCQPTVPSLPSRRKPFWPLPRRSKKAGMRIRWAVRHGSRRCWLRLAAR